MDMSLLREFVRLDRLSKQKKREYEDVKDERDKLEQRVLEQFVEEGVQNMQLGEGFTVYLHREVWATLADGASKEDAIEALRAAGQGHFVRDNYSSQTVSAWMRDLDRNEEALPEELVGVLEPHTRFSARVRRT